MRDRSPHIYAKEIKREHPFSSLPPPPPPPAKVIFFCVFIFFLITFLLSIAEVRKKSQKKRKLKTLFYSMLLLLLLLLLLFALLCFVFVIFFCFLMELILIINHSSPQKINKINRYYSLLRFRSPRRMLSLQERVNRRQICSLSSTKIVYDQRRLFSSKIHS